MALLPGTELVVAGGPDRAALAWRPGIPRLRRIARQLGVADRVLFTGAVPRAQVPGLIRSADLVVCTPWYEPFGITPLEAMACGVPVVASSVGGLTDTVVHGGTGLLVPPRDAAATAAAASALLGEARRRAAFGQAGAAVPAAGIPGRGSPRRPRTCTPDSVPERLAAGWRRTGRRTDARGGRPTAGEARPLAVGARHDAAAAPPPGGRGPAVAGAQPELAQHLDQLTAALRTQPPGWPPRGAGDGCSPHR